MSPIDCRSGCGACCIAPSISSPIPGMPNGKPAGIRCAQLSDDYRCAIFGQPERPEVCRRLRPTRSMCGADREEAIAALATLELQTRPGGDADERDFRAAAVAAAMPLSLPQDNDS